MKKLSHDEFVKKVNEAHGKDIEILGKYINKRTKVLIKHKCGYTWKTNPQTLYKGHGCPLCGGNVKKNTTTIKKEIFELVGDEYELLDEYINTNTPILFKHNICGNIFKMSPKAFIVSGQRCPKERYIKSAKSNSIPFYKIKMKIESLGKGDYEIVSEYVKSSQKVTFLHHSCGKTFELQPTRFIQGGIRCPYCYRSKGEEVISDYLKSNNIKFKEQYKIQECKNKRPLPFDFAIFEDDKLKCLIEYDGSQHYQAKFGVGKDEYLKIKYNDTIKNNYCKENNIILIRIKYVRSENPNIFKSKVIKKLENEFEKYNMTIPSQVNKETFERCND